MGGLLSQMEYLFQYYAQSYEQSYQNFKDAFSARLSNTQKELERRTGQKVKIDPEKHPAFREEWLKAVSQLNAQYEKILAETKEKLINVP